MGEIIWYLSFTTWLISLSIMLSSFMHAVTKGRNWGWGWGECWGGGHGDNCTWTTIKKKNMFKHVGEGVWQETGNNYYLSLLHRNSLPQPQPQLVDKARQTTWPFCLPFPGLVSVGLWLPARVTRKICQVTGQKAERLWFLRHNSMYGTPILCKGVYGILCKIKRTAIVLNLKALESSESNLRDYVYVKSDCPEI